MEELARFMIAGMVCHGMELFEAITKPTIEECLRYTKEADVLVGIIAWHCDWAGFQNYPVGARCHVPWFCSIEKSRF